MISNYLHWMTNPVSAGKTEMKIKTEPDQGSPAVEFFFVISDVQVSLKLLLKASTSVKTVQLLSVWQTPPAENPQHLILNCQAGYALACHPGFADPRQEPQRSMCFCNFITENSFFCRQ